MHARELVQLAEYVAHCGPQIVRSRVAIPEPALELYWTASKCRLDRWSRALKSLAAIPFEVNGSWESVERVDASVLDEILLADVLTRTWMAICRASDQYRGFEEAGPVAASVLAGQAEVRQRVLNFMVYGQGIGVENAVNLNRRRRKYEQRTDWLLSLLASLCEISDLAFEAPRVERWAIAKRNDLKSRGTDWAASVCLAAAATSFAKPAPRPTGNEDLNGKIACGIIGSFPTTVFDTTGCVVSNHYLDLWQPASDTQGRVNIATPSAGSEDLPEFHRRHGRFDPPQP
jgi:hypothetical protein